MEGEKSKGIGKYPKESPVRLCLFLGVNSFKLKANGGGCCCCCCCCCCCWWWWNWQVLFSIVHLVNLVFQQVDGTRKWVLPPGSMATSGRKVTWSGNRRFEFLRWKMGLFELWFDYSLFSLQSSWILQRMYLLLLFLFLFLLSFLHSFFSEREVLKIL